jgi:hypothetical protein
MKKIMPNKLENKRKEINDNPAAAIASLIRKFRTSTSLSALLK